MPTLPAWLRETDHLGAAAYDAVDAFADDDPAILASLRTSTDEDAIADALETQLTGIAAAQTAHTAPVIPMRRRARTPEAEQRAA